MNNTDRLGYYLVGWKKFYNKTLALIESKRSGYQLKWIFNDQVYGNINWSSPIEISLTELYRQRAQQLRDQYDYLILYFSGGADSMNVLQAFIDNDIFIDEVIMQIPEPFLQQANATDTSSKNFFSEIPYSAAPYINKYKGVMNPNTKIRYQDFSKSLLELFNKEDWFETNAPNARFTLGIVGRQVAQLTDPYILKLCETKKSIAQIMGVDKPLVYFDGVNYYAYFSDSNANHVPPINSEQNEIFRDVYHAEYFYWTPSMPELVIKQAQEIKKYCEINTAARDLIAQSLKRHIGDFKPLIHSIVYPPSVKVDFETEKVDSKTVRPADDWFWNVASEKQIQNYMYAIDYFKQNVSENSFIGKDVHNGISATNSEFYKL